MSTTTDDAPHADLDALNTVFAQMEAEPSAAYVDTPTRSSRTRMSPTSFDADDTPSRNWLSILLGIVSVMCFAIGLFEYFQSNPTPITPSAVASAPSTPQFKSVTRNIEDFDVGLRVTGRNPLRDQVETLSEPDPETSRKLLLRMQKESGLYLKIKLLRSLDWIAHVGATEGGTFYLELPEMGAVGDAFVEAVIPCPEIADGPGNIVTGVFEHEAEPDAKILSVTFANGAHIKGVTDNHPFYSVDRNEFVPVGEMRTGETVQVNNGTTTITEITSRTVEPGTLLYNLETHNEHVFQVTLAGVLVHNSCADRAVSAARRHGGVEVKPGHYEFPSRAAARRAASEIAGNLGPNPRAIRLGADMRDVPGRLKDSARVVGRETLDRTAGWRDDFLGHRFDPRPHVNAWAEGLDFHLWY